jgi:hypothetical protein
MLSKIRNTLPNTNIHGTTKKQSKVLPRRYNEFLNVSEVNHAVGKILIALYKLHVGSYILPRLKIQLNPSPISYTFTALVDQLAL